MARPRRWYDSEASLAVRVVPRAERELSYVSLRWKHPRTRPTLGECLVYPLSDGPGLGLLVLFPPLLWALSLPIFDVIAVLEPVTKGNWALGLMVMPVFLPLMFSFAMTFGYVLLFLGHVLISSALGENEHPRWPEWHPAEISEGIARWFWALLQGVILGALPVAAYWAYAQKVDWLHGFVFLDLLFVGVAFGQMALAASLMHETILAANPITVLTAIFRVGWAYLVPCAVAAAAVSLEGLGLYGLLFRMPKMWMEAVALWAYWVFFLYQAMVVMRMLGLTYHAHALELLWFRRRPGWACSRRDGRLYANS
jgi:hypothetical protein